MILENIVNKIDEIKALITNRKKSKTLFLIREQKTSYSIEQTTFKKFENEQKRIVFMYNNSTHYLYKNESGKYAIYEEEHHYVSHLFGNVLEDQLIYYRNGKASRMIDIKDNKKDAKRSCLDHLLQRHDLRQAGKVYFKNEDANKWKEYARISKK